MTDAVPPQGPPGRVPPAQYPAGPPLAPPPPPTPPGTTRPAGDWPGPEEQPMPARRVPFWVLGVAILAVGALIGGLIAVVTQNDGNGDELVAPSPDSTTSPSEPPSTASTAPPPTLEEVVAEIEAFVERERGLPFLREVTVELADEGEFQDRLLDDFEESTEDLRTTGLVLQALGVVPAGSDVVDAFRGLLGAGVVGFYDSATDELVVRGGAVSPYVRTVIAHELTHALDDQHFELERPALEDAEDESSYGFTALVEGNASRVERAYRATLSPSEEADAAAEEEALVAGYFPDAVSLPLLEAVVAPYLLGPGLVEALLEDGGQARLDGAFVDPPTTSEAMLDPDSFIAGQPTVPVPAPVADGPVIDQGVLGAAGLAQVLGLFGPIITLGGDVPDSVLGWGGDAYVAWTVGDQACVRANLVGDTPADTREIAEALAAWAADLPSTIDAEVSGSELVTLTSCA